MLNPKTCVDITGLKKYILNMQVFSENQKTLRKYYLVNICEIQYSYHEIGNGCGFPGSPAHSTVHLDEESTYSPGAIATYTCDQGFELLGPSAKVCSKNGTWTPPGIPFCGNISQRSLQQVFSLQNIECRNVYKVDDRSCSEQLLSVPSDGQMGR